MREARGRWLAFIDDDEVPEPEWLAELLRVQRTCGADAVRGPADAGGVDWAFECVGHPSVLRDAVDVLDWGGNCASNLDRKLFFLVFRFQ